MLNKDMEDDVFDILGISSKEDCFTNLLAGAFNKREHKLFRNKFCSMLSNESFIILNSDDCKIYTRGAYNIKKDDNTGGRGKVLPDMIMISPSQKAVVIIENKIFSREGYKQTIAYSSPNFIKILNDKLLIKHKIESGYKKEFYFMTLLGETASSKDFKPLKWTDLIIETINNIDNEELVKPYDVLLTDLNSRAKELKDFIETPLNPENSFAYYYGHINKWIDGKVVISKFFNSILEDIAAKYVGEVEYHISKADGRSEQLLILLTTPKWRSKKSLNQYRKGDSVEEFQHTRNIHMEFSWQVEALNASVLLHYESNPYFPDEKLKKLYPEIEPKYKENREAFKNGLQVESDSKYWLRANTKLALAKAPLKDFMSLPYGDFKKWFSNVFDEAYEMISHVINKEG